jgi:hypothetical protein
VLWVDAICINQQGMAERNCQVKHIKRIYEQAMSITAWLDEAADEAADDSHLALKRLKYTTCWILKRCKVVLLLK